MSLLFNQTCLNERLLSNYTYIYIYIYIFGPTTKILYIYICIYIYKQDLASNNHQGLIYH